MIELGKTNPRIVCTYIYFAPHKIWTLKGALKCFLRFSFYVNFSIYICHVPLFLCLLTLFISSFLSSLRILTSWPLSILNNSKLHSCTADLHVKKVMKDCDTYRCRRMTDGATEPCWIWSNDGWRLSATCERWVPAWTSGWPLKDNLHIAKHCENFWKGLAVPWPMVTLSEMGLNSYGGR